MRPRPMVKLFNHGGPRFVWLIPAAYGVWVLWAWPVHAALDLATVIAYGALTARAVLWDGGVLITLIGALWGSSRRNRRRPPWGALRNERIPAIS